jgi:hypothetical protein
MEGQCVKADRANWLRPKTAWLIRPIIEVANLPQERHWDKSVRQRRCRSLAVNRVRLKEDWETQNV